MGGGQGGQGSQGSQGGQGGQGGGQQQHTNQHAGSHTGQSAKQNATNLTTEDAKSEQSRNVTQDKTDDAVSDSKFLAANVSQGSAWSLSFVVKMTSAAALGALVVVLASLVQRSRKPSMYYQQYVQMEETELYK